MNHMTYLKVEISAENKKQADEILNPLLESKCVNRWSNHFCAFKIFVEG